MWATVLPQSIRKRCVLLRHGMPFQYKPASSNRICSCADSLKQAVPLPRHIMLVDKGSEVSSSQVLWLQSCCHNRWNEEYDEDLVMKQEQGVAAALQNSSTVLAAFCRADSVAKMVPEEHMMRLPGLLQSSPADSGNGKPPQKDWLQQRAARRQKVLVGLVRASSDRHFVGTLESIMIHPGLQRRGLGRRLLMKACNMLFAAGVTDIGTWVTTDNEEFFTKCGFGADKFNSVAMVLDQQSPTGQLLAAGAQWDLETRLKQDAQDMRHSCKINRVEQALLKYVVPQ